MAEETIYIVLRAAAEQTDDIMAAFHDEIDAQKYAEKKASQDPERRFYVEPCGLREARKQKRKVMDRHEFRRLVAKHEGAHGD